MQHQKGQSDSKKQSGRWSKQEHQRFMLGLMQHGKNWKKVEEIVATRSGSQVRSHAQKFFNKIQKCTKQSKGSKNKNPFLSLQDHNQQDVSLTENNDIMRSYDQDNSLATPMQIISLIKKQSVDNRKVNLSSFKKSLQENQEKHNLNFTLVNNNITDKNESFLEKAKKDDPNASSVGSSSMGALNSFKSMNNILSAYEALNEADPQNRYEDQSFLIGITKRYKKYFSKGGQFQNLIDFGNPHEVAKAAQMQKSLRKKSWTLAQGIEGNQNDLQDIKKKIKQNIAQQKKSEQNVKTNIVSPRKQTKNQTGNSLQNNTHSIQNRPTQQNPKQQNSDEHRFQIKPSAIPPANNIQNNTISNNINSQNQAIKTQSKEA